MWSYNRLAMPLAVYSILSADHGAVDGGAIIPFEIIAALDSIWAVNDKYSNNSLQAQSRYRHQNGLYQLSPAETSLL